ncbi:hypothetical protein C0J52_08282 [Blattella germanica]|nr:hypothetical protein C0J52_08282 [Blattella germanica]
MTTPTIELAIIASVMDSRKSLCQSLPKRKIYHSLQMILIAAVSEMKSSSFIRGRSRPQRP